MRKRSIRAVTAASAIALGLALTATPAAAHVTVGPTEQTAGEFTVLTFSVPHGCEEAGTTKIEIEIPDPIISVTPTVNLDWDVEIVKEPLDEPIEGEGETISERVAQVVYTKKGAPLPHDLRDKMELSLQVPEDQAGNRMFFPTVQTCSQGETAWIEIPEDGQDPFELEDPAPFIEVAAAEGDGGATTTTVGDGATTTTGGDNGSAAGVTTSDDGTDTVAVIALIIAIIAALLGAAAFFTRRRAA